MSQAHSPQTQRFIPPPPAANACPSPDWLAPVLHFALHPGLTPAEKTAIARAVTQAGDALRPVPPPGLFIDKDRWKTWLQPHHRIRDALAMTQAWLSESAQHRVLGFWDADYPHRLRQLPRPPFVLFLNGSSTLLLKPAIALVGSRHATRAGLRRARSFSAALAQRGWTIVSGLAKGIDAAAHWGALESQGGTIAVLGCGIDVLYPAENAELKTALLAQGGLLLSEYPPLTPPQPVFFPHRNRIIAALCEGLLVVEATPRSGSLITADQANQLGKAVMALPGSLDSPQARGCHQMIRQGAALVETIEHIESEIGSWAHPAPGNQAAPAQPAQLALALPALSTLGAQVLALFSGEPLHFDHLATVSKLGTDSLSAALLELELNGQLERQPGQWWLPC